VKEVLHSVGDKVAGGTVLARAESNAGLQVYPLVAALGGEVLRRNISVGEYVTPETEAFLVSDIRSVWVNLIVRAPDLPRLKVQDQVTVLTRDKRGQTTGKLFFVSPVLDEHTLTGTASLEVDNSRGNWRAGSLVDGYVEIAKMPTHASVRSDAIRYRQGKAYLIVKSESDTLTARPIRLGRQDLRMSEVLMGAKRGESYVALTPIKKEASAPPPIEASGPFPEGAAPAPAEEKGAETSEVGR
jgi:cobalt-zinc-cadmium efflux system membrane fusion protein